MRIVGCLARTRAALCVVLATAASGCCSYARGDKARKSPPLVVTLTISREVYRAGEPVEAEIALRNVSDGTVKVLNRFIPDLSPVAGGRPAEGHQLAIEGVNVQCPSRQLRPASFLDWALGTALTKRDVVDLRAGDVLEARRDDLTQFFGMKAPGMYRFRVTYAPGSPDVHAKREGVDYWSGNIVSNYEYMLVVQSDAEMPATGRCSAAP